MRSVIEIIRHELVSHRSILLAAAVLGVLAPFMVVWERDHPQLLGLTLGTAFGICTAVFLGGSSILREQRGDTLSLYFGLPSSELSIWWGKLFGSALLAIIAQALVGVPALIVFANRLHVTGDLNLAYGLTFLLLLPLVALAHVVGTWLRSEPDLLIFDLIALASLTLALVLGHSWLLEVGAQRAMVVFGIVLGAVLCIAAFLAGAYQLSRGRSDQRRGRVALSQALWSPVLISAVVTLGAARWTSDIEPFDTSHFHNLQSIGTSPWISYGGLIMDEPSLRMGAHAGFLHNVDTGDWHRTPRNWRSVSLCDDGKTAARLQEGSSGPRLVTFDLASLDVSSDVPWPWHEPLKRGWAGLSPDCRFVAVVSVLWTNAEGPFQEARLVVIETATGKLRFNTELDSEVFVGGSKQALAAHFDGTWLSENELRVFATTSSHYQILDVVASANNPSAETALVVRQPDEFSLQRAVRNRNETLHLLHATSENRSHLTLLDETGTPLWSHELDDGARSWPTLVGNDVLLSRRTTPDSSTIFLIRDGEIARSWPIDYDLVLLGPSDPQGRLVFLASDRGPDANRRQQVFRLDPRADETTANESALEAVNGLGLPDGPVLSPQPEMSLGPSRQPQTDETLGRLWSHVTSLWIAELESGSSRRVI